MTATAHDAGVPDPTRPTGYRIAVVGATGAVGTVMLRCLHERGLDLDNEIVLFASERSAG